MRRSVGIPMGGDRRSVKPLTLPEHDQLMTLNIYSSMPPAHNACRCYGRQSG